MRKTTLLLTGGLGNQLFQLSAGLSQGSESLELASEIGNPREIGGKPALFSLKLPSETIPLNLNKLKFWTKLMGFTLRRGIEPRLLEKVFVLRTALNLITNFLFSFLLKRRVRHFAATDVGYSGTIPSEKNLLIGYFQTYRYMESELVASKMLLLRPISQSQALMDLMAKAKKDKPIVIHVRLGDYVSEEHFGIPSPQYYREALEKLDQKEERQVWVFSDDHSLASKSFMNNLDSRCRLIDDHELNAAEVLELMRCGSDYIIGNSSFSWWAAFLSHNRSAKVVCPDPWFKGMPEPRDLIPTGWIRRDAQWM